ncbi:hypothetical protein OF850_12720 [Roseococcus sp. MDT2-1-1]|uniref:Uncharacterized protein n=2 Tax=Sabulicella glaciei TaxID=2984948 RepID=A0ABT3NWG0_9PROT|nr:hypothetical protein [Roseococcus sp. MDT2-1-1]
MVLMEPPMLAAGLLVGAVEPARGALADATLAAGALVGAGIAFGLLTDSIVFGDAVGQDPERARMPYQVAGLATATAASLAALRMVMTSGAARLAWDAAALLLGAAVLLPGGRAAFLAAGAGAAFAPALWLGRRERLGAALLWPLGVAVAGMLALAVLLADPGRAAALLTLERLTRPEGGLDGTRWAAALARRLWRRGGRLSPAPARDGAAQRRRDRGADPARRGDGDGFHRSRQPHGVIRPGTHALRRDHGAARCIGVAASARWTWPERRCCWPCWRPSWLPLG